MSNKETYIQRERERERERERTREKEKKELHSKNERTGALV